MDVEITTNADGDVTSEGDMAISLPGIMVDVAFRVQCLECGHLIQYSWHREAEDDFDEVVQFEVQCDPCTTRLGKAAVVAVSLPVGEQADQIDELVEQAIAAAEENAPPVSAESNVEAPTSVIGAAPDGADHE